MANHKDTQVRSISRLFFALFIFFTSTPFSAAQESREIRIFPALARIKATVENANGVPLSSSATGFIISPTGYLLTVRHILDALSTARPGTLKFSIQIGSESQNLDASSIILSDSIADLLVIKLPTPLSDRKHLCFVSKTEDSKFLINDTRIYSSGFPDSVPYINTEGFISTFDGPGNTWLTSLAIYAGQSGSPIYTASGQIVGIAKGEHKDLPGMYAFIPARHFRTQLANFSNECASPNVNVSRGGPQNVDLSRTSLPLPTECIFLGKLSALASRNLNDAPFGTQFLNSLVQSNPQTFSKSPISALTDVNIRSNCPTVRDTGAAYYGSVTRVLKAGQSVTPSKYQSLSYGGDTFYWAEISSIAQQ